MLNNLSIFWRETDVTMTLEKDTHTEIKWKRLTWRETDVTMTPSRQVTWLQHLCLEEGGIISWQHGKFGKENLSGNSNSPLEKSSRLLWCNRSVLQRPHNPDRVRKRFPYLNRYGVTFRRVWKTDFYGRRAGCEKPTKNRLIQPVFGRSTNDHLWYFIRIKIISFKKIGVLLSPLFP